MGTITFDETHLFQKHPAHSEEERQAYKTSGIITVQSASANTLNVGILDIKKILYSIKSNGSTTPGGVSIIAAQSATAGSIDVTAANSDGEIELFIEVEGNGAV